MTANSKKNGVLDHDHNTGYLRDVLCTNCNGIEGQIWRRLHRIGLDPKEALSNLALYWERHSAPQHGGIFHYTHKTEEEKRLLRNKRARERRNKAKKT